MIFAVLDPSPLTVCINCSFFYIYRGSNGTGIDESRYTAKLTNVILTGFKNTGWAKKVIPLVQCNICTSGITFLAHPVDVIW